MILIKALLDFQNLEGLPPERNTSKMKRSDFLKSLGFGSAGLLLPKRLAENELIKIYDNYVYSPSRVLNP